MRLRAALFACLMLALSACGDLVEPAAAVVRGNKIPMSEVTEAVKEFQSRPDFEELAGQQGGARAVKRRFEQGYLSTLIRRAVLEPRAEHFGIEVTDDMVEARLDQIRADFPDQEAFEQAVRQQGLTIEQLKLLIHDRLLEQRLRTRVTQGTGATEEELRRFYERNIDDFRQTEVQHILVEDRQLARSIASQLQQAPRGRVDELFRRLAAKHSTDPSNADDAGKLGFFSPGDFVPEFERAASRLDLGEISEPVKTQFGYHIIRVTDRRTQSFEDVRADVEQQVAGSDQERVWRRWLRRVYDAADVKVNPRYGRFDLDSQTIVDPTAGDVPGTDEPDPLQAPEEGG